MFITEILIIEQKDLIYDAKHKSIDDIVLSDINKIGLSEIAYYNMIILNVNNQTKVLKNRWGKQGVVK